MKNNTNHLLVNTMPESLKAARTIFKNENSLDLMIEIQVKEFSKLRKEYPNLSRNETIKISILNTCTKLKKNQSERFFLSVSKSIKATPQLNWLKLHKSFVFKLHSNGASLREISYAIYYRFHHKISHTQVATFLKMEVYNVI